MRVPPRPEVRDRVAVVLGERLAGDIGGEDVLDDGVEAVLDALTSSAKYAIELRVNSPFAGTLTEPERRRVLEAFAESRRDRARPMGPEKLERVLRSV